MMMKMWCIPEIAFWSRFICVNSVKFDQLSGREPVHIMKAECYFVQEKQMQIYMHRMINHEDDVALRCVRSRS
jgi:hypothetical protein